MLIVFIIPLNLNVSTIENLLPIFPMILKDEFAEVRLNVISKLQDITQGTDDPVF
jgi:hypothetical protein